MAIALPAVKFQIAYPQIQKNVSMSRSGGKAMAFIEWADDAWSITMRTKPLNASERLMVEVFRDQAQDGLVTVAYTPKHMCLPQAYWGNPDAPALANTGALATITNPRSLVVNSVDNGLTLGPGDLIGFAYGDYRAMCRVTTGGVAATNAIALTVEPPLPAYIQTAAVVTFKNPTLNMRVVPGSFSIPDDFFPVASFTLVEVPK